MVAVILQINQYIYIYLYQDTNPVMAKTLCVSLGELMHVVFTMLRRGTLQ